MKVGEGDNGCEVSNGSGLVLEIDGWLVLVWKALLIMQRGVVLSLNANDTDWPAKNV